MAACLDLRVEIVQPTGFRFDDVSLQRAGLDYLERATILRHANWDTFEEMRKQEKRRLVLLTTKAEQTYTDFEFCETDCLLFGRESAGVPESVHETADKALTIPMAATGRSLNLAVSVAMVAGEALRQLKAR